MQSLFAICVARGAQIQLTGLCKGLPRCRGAMGVSSSSRDASEHLRRPVTQPRGRGMHAGLALRCAAWQRGDAHRHTHTRIRATAKEELCPTGSQRMILEAFRCESGPTSGRPLSKLCRRRRRSSATSRWMDRCEKLEPALRALMQPRFRVPLWPGDAGDLLAVNVALGFGRVR